MLGRAFYEQLKPRAALAQNEKARNLPGNGRMMRLYGIFLSRIGHAKDAVATFAAGTLDPLDSDSWIDQAWVCNNVGRYADSIVAAKTSLELAPDGQVFGWQFLGVSLIELGKVSEGLAALAHMPPDTPQRLSGEIFAYQKTGQQAAADRKTQLRHGSGDAVNSVLASFYARQGKIEPALQALERAWAARDPWLIDLPILDSLQPLRNEPRFKAI